MLGAVLGHHIPSGIIVTNDAGGVVSSASHNTHERKSHISNRVWKHIHSEYRNSSLETKHAFCQLTEDLCPNSQSSVLDHIANTEDEDEGSERTLKFLVQMKRDKM
eukprot:11178238-Ditylum_brightwellii.AAC.1